MFKRLLNLTIVAVFFLIFIGSVVRSTGAGMGCPDWPKCFGGYIPPSSEAELPSDYARFYTESRLKKNLRLESMFALIGMQDVLHDRQKNHTTYSDVYYDGTKAWIEYLNRLVGVLVGLLVLGCFLFSLKYLSGKFSVVFWCFVSLIVLIFEAFLGSFVVSTNLFPDLISVHMILAVALVFMLIYVKFLIKDKVPQVSRRVPNSIWFLSLMVLVISFGQMLLGISVREEIDELHNYANIFTGEIDLLSVWFKVHRSFSILVTMINIYFVYLLIRYGWNNEYSKWILPIIGAEIFFGVALSYLDMPAIAQPFHLLLSTLLLGMQFFSFLSIKFVSKNKS